MTSKEKQSLITKYPDHNGFCNSYLLNRAQAVIEMANATYMSKDIQVKELYLLLLTVRDATAKMERLDKQPA